MATSSPRTLFGTDGMRGCANVFPLTPDVALQVGKAMAQIGRSGPSPVRVVIGKDTRRSGPMLESALAAGVASMGGEAWLAGCVPTPAVAELVVSLRASAGVVISASHNPFEDNGIKLFGADGFKLPDEAEAEIERLLQGEPLRSDVTGARVGQILPLGDAAGRYIVHAKASFPRGASLAGLKLVVDAAHGAAYEIAPRVFSELGADVVTVGCAPNGININQDCGAIHPEHVSKQVKRHRANLGIALDGDADRLIVVDEKGNVVDGDAILALCATRAIARRALPKRTLVATVVSNMGLEHAMAAAGGKLRRTAVGDRYVVEEMRRGGFTIGGEQSGHLVFLDHATTGDGIVAALQVLAIMVAEQRPLSELGAVMERVPQLLESVRLPARRPLEEMPKLSKMIQRVEQKLGRRGRVLVRWSGTEPKLRVMVEGPRPDALATLAKSLIAAAQQDLST